MNAFFLANPAGLWAFAVVAAAFILYLFYRRYRPQAVTGLFLWGIPRREGIGGRKVEKPFWGRSLLLDLLAAALLALAVCVPSFRGATGMPVVVVLDNSFAMRARDGRAAARAAASAVHAAADRAGVATALILAGERPEVRRSLGPVTRGEWSALMEEYQPTAGVSDLQAAVVLARSLYGQNFELHIVTNRDDAVFAGTDVRTTVHILPGNGGNLAFVRAWRERENVARERLILAVANYGGATRAVVSVAGALSPDAPLHTEEVELAAGGVTPVEITLALVDDRALVVRLLGEAGGDVIDDDSLAYVTLDGERTATYLTEHLNPAAERYVSMALEAAGCRPSPWDAEGVPPPDILVTTDSGRSGRIVTLEFAPAGEAAVYAPPYVVDVTDPLCRDINLNAVPWVVATRAVPDNAGAALVAAGDMPLYWRSSPGRLHLNLAPERCLIVQDSAWPVLFANLASFAVARMPGLGKTLYAPGETLRYRAASGGDRAAVEFRSATGAVVPALGRETPVPREAGLYSLRDGERAVGDIAVLPLYGRASDTTALAAAAKTLLSDPGAGAQGRGARDLTWLALLLALLLLGANWYAGLSEGRRA